MSASLETLAAGMRLAPLRRFLLGSGWSRVRAGVGFELFRLKPAPPDGEPAGPSADPAVPQTSPRDEPVEVEVVLPTLGTARDYRFRIMDVIGTLSQIYQKDPWAVTREINTFGFDVVRSRIPDKYVESDSVRLDTAVRFLDDARKLIAASATTELDPEPYFGRVKKEAAEYVERCLFGHTFHGSFGFTIECPLAPNDVPTFSGVEQAAPFERRVVQRLAHGMRQMEAAVQSDAPEMLAESHGSGFSANMCEIFADLVEKTAPDGLVFEVRFSPEWKTSAELERGTDLTAGPRHVAMARSAARLLRVSPGPKDAEIFGRVVRLQADTDPSDLLDPVGSREIAVQWGSEELGEVLVRMNLRPEDYLTAIEAHRQGRPVRVGGTLEKPGRYWTLFNPVGLTVAG